MLPDYWNRIKAVVVSILSTRNGSGSLGAASFFSSATGGLRFVANTDWQSGLFRTMCIAMAFIGVCQAFLIVFLHGQARQPKRGVRARGG